MSERTTALTPEWQGLGPDGRLVLALSRGAPWRALLDGGGAWATDLKPDDQGGRIVLEMRRDGQPETVLSTVLPATVIRAVLAHGAILLAEAAGDLVTPLFEVELSDDELGEVAWLKRELAARHLRLVFKTSSAGVALGLLPDE